ncbi:IS3 family transposase [Niallia sp. FSL W8-1348]|uniref:IS3 family transposase n=1 Tax=Niallia sp. FSL W8-1348 TaxID=2954656 RepID=UPI000399AF2E
MIESFHSNLKAEEFQYCKFNTLSNLEVISRVEGYIHHYNEDRIQAKLGYLTPKEFGLNAA